MNSVDRDTARSDRIVTVPNLLSVVRLLGVPLFVYLLLVTHSDGWALAILMISGFTDCGWLRMTSTSASSKSVSVRSASLARRLTAKRLMTTSAM